MIVTGGRALILGVEFDLVHYVHALETIEHWRGSGQRHFVTFTNGRGVILSSRDRHFRRALARATLTLPDGIGIILAAKLFGYAENGRVTGPSFMLQLSEWGCPRGYRHFFYGGSQGVAHGLAERLCAKYPGIRVVGTHCPPFRALTEDEDAAVISKINATRPDVLWVALGAPKQEKWMASHEGRIHAAAMIGVGAAFDFHAGRIKWAPAWVRRLGMEWLYRAIRDPRRVAPRAKHTLLFAAKVFCEAALRSVRRARR